MTLESLIIFWKIVPTPDLAFFDVDLILRHRFAKMRNPIKKIQILSGLKSLAGFYFNGVHLTSNVKISLFHFQAKNIEYSDKNSFISAMTKFSNNPLHNVLSSSSVLIPNK